jgi:hypothetical protein
MFFRRGVSPDRHGRSTGACPDRGDRSTGCYRRAHLVWLYRSRRALSMDNERDYGECFFQMSYKEAIRQHIISDYKILTVTVSDNRIRRLIEKNRILILNLNLRDLDEAAAQSVATGIALKRLFKEHGIKHAISFHRSLRAADHFRGQQDAFNRIRDIGPRGAVRKVVGM